MAIDSFIGAESTEAWTLPEKVFYPTDIHIGHSQLRHLISSPSPNIVYFVDGRKVFCLDTLTSTRILVTELPFRPICTASGFGWFCAGGEEHGKFAAIRVPETQDMESSDGEYLPDCTRPSAVLDHLTQLYSVLPPPIRVEHLGKLILNSISLHVLHGTDDEIEDEVVAVLTNNDKTVRIYSLTQDREIMREEFDFPMNHATLSPNGKTMMVVGDKEVAYFYRRVDGRSEVADGINGRALFQQKSWVPLREITLHKPQNTAISAYFTTAWSQNGRLCATASENGIITLMDCDALLDLDRDPVIAQIPSSRPDSPFGGVRTMCFAPDPWDLLIWNEDRGRMCMVDVRHGLHVRQINVLDPHSNTVKHTNLLDASVHLSDPQGLTEQELQILDGLRTTRQRQEGNGAVVPGAGITPRSINYTTSRSRQRLSNPAVLSSIRDYLRDQNWTRISETSTRRPNSLSRRGDSPTQAAQSNLTRTSGFSPHARNSDPWRIIEAAISRADSNIPHEVNMASPGANTPPSDDDDDSLPPLVVASDHPSPRRANIPIPNLREIDETPPESRTLRRMREDANNRDRESRLRMADLEAHSPWRSGNSSYYNSSSRSDEALREHIAELEAEVDATERQLLRGNNSTTPTPPPDTGPSERELAERRRRLLAIAAVSEEVSGGSERRRRIRESRGSSIGNFPSVMWYSPRSERDGALTTRGEAVLARQREQRAAIDREREINNETEPSSDGMRAAHDASMQGIRQHGWMRDEIRRRSRLNELSVDSSAFTTATNAAMEAEGGMRTTGMAWGDARSLYVGTEFGIFELTLDFSERMFRPARNMR